MRRRVLRRRATNRTTFGLRALGLAQSARFTWGAAAAGTVDTYRRALSR